MPQQFLLWLGSSLVTTAALGTAGWLARNWLITRLRASVAHEFDQKIERVRSELRKGEDELNAVRTTALHALSAKETARDERRVKSIEAVWEAMLELRKLHYLAAKFEILNYDVLSARVKDEPKLRQFIEVSFGDPDAIYQRGEEKIARAEIARPWLSPMIWALFEAYRAGIGYARAIAVMLKLGEDPRELTSSEKIVEFLAAALPNDVASFTPFKPALLAAILTQIEVRLLAAIREDVDGVEPDLASVQRAQQIAKVASGLRSVSDDRNRTTIENAATSSM